jgi:hypothetical protein
MIIHKKAKMIVMVNDEKDENDRNDRKKIIRPRRRKGRLELRYTLLAKQE